MKTKGARQRILLPIIRTVAASNVRTSLGFLITVIGSDKGNLKRWLNKKPPGGMGQ